MTGVPEDASSDRPPPPPPPPPRRAIVVLNAGSSSLKFSIYRVGDAGFVPDVRGQIDGLGGAARLIVKDARGEVLADEPGAGAGGGSGAADTAHREAFARVAAWIRGHFGDDLSVLAVGHRVVHGGAEYSAPTRIDGVVLAKLDALVPLAPLHQPHNLAVIRAVAQSRPDLPQVACFDTAFHRGRAEVTERFALPEEYFRRGVRRWGFHGLSYQSIARRLREIAPDVAAGRVIVAHLGNGASLCAMRDGRSVDTTMSFSTLDGLPMGTRCGSLDPGVVLHLLKQLGPDGVERLLYHDSGLRGVSGISNDLRDLLASDNPRAAAAVELFVYRIVREIGSLAAALGGLDGLVFTAGIGENSPDIRRRVCEQCGWLGIGLDAALNARGPRAGRRISPAGRSPSAWVIATDEEREIAEGTLSLLDVAR